jgi:hypothetical protein
MDFFITLTQQLQQNFNNEGYMLPPQPASNITMLQPGNAGTILYNSDTGKGMINENGIFKTITTS